MARKVDKTPKLCVICGDKAKGINFNALTCMSCKAFFRRNALRNKEMKCPFSDVCQVDKITRKFCSKCRLKKCFDSGMKKEWILSDEEKRLIKEKILRNRLRRQQQQEVEAQQASAISSGKRRSMESHLKTAAKVQSSGQKRRHTASKANFLPSGKTAAYRNRNSLPGAFEGNGASGNSHLFSALNSNAQPTYTQQQQPQQSHSSFNPGNLNNGASSGKYSGAAALNAFNIFQEPSAYSLDILLSDNCDAFFDSGPTGSNFNGPSTAGHSVLDEWLGSTVATSGSSSGHEKKDDFLQSLVGTVGDIDDSLNSTLNDCCNLLFSNNMNSIDLFENDPEMDELTFSGSSSALSECNESNQSELYEVHIRQPNNNAATRLAATGDIVVKEELLEPLSAPGHITSVTTGSNSTFEYTPVKNENDYSQYLLHDNDPTFNLTAGTTLNVTAIRTANMLPNGSHPNNKPAVANFSSLNSNFAASGQTIASQSIPLAQKSYPPSSSNHSWDASSALQVVTPSYQSTGDLYGNRSKVPPLMKMTQADVPEKKDFISKCLIAINDQSSEESCNYDPVIEDVPRIGNTHEVMLRDIGFSNRELILPERCLIKELTEACSVLKNPYKRILVFNNYDSVRSCRITEYSFHRLIRMSKRLSRFSQLRLSDQARMLKYSLLEMLAMRSVLSYNPDRESWGFIDDKCKVNVMVRMDVIRPFSTKCGFQRHKNFPNLFRHEWKNDSIIFDLLTAIVLFTPRPGMCEYEKSKEEHNRYVYLLRRYLEIKYPTLAEAKESFSQLLGHIEEMRQLNADIMFFFRSYSSLLQSSPLFTQLLDLETDAAPSSKLPDNQNQNSDPNSVYGDSSVFEDPNNMFANLDVNPQMDNSGISSMSATNFPTNPYGGSLDSGTGTANLGHGGAGTGATNSGSMSFGVSTNGCILNTAN